MTERAIECAPLLSEREAREQLADTRLGADACVGDAMGCIAVCVHAQVLADAVTGSLAAEGAIVAIVVDDLGRLVGLMDAERAARTREPTQARELARRVAPVRESAPLADAVERMVQERARALPVVDGEGRVVALLTDLDALRWVARGASR